MSRFDAWLTNVLHAVVFLLLSAIIVVVGANVACRYVGNAALSWGEEVAQGLLIWLCFLGAGLAAKHGQHFAVGVLTAHVKGVCRRTLRALIGCVVCGFLLLLLVQSARYTWLSRGQSTPSLGISIVWVYAAGPTGTALMLYYFAQATVRELLSKTES